ncbi:MAG: hypothetical protein B7Y80_17980, partial [Hyphomicrobium sp. 32-62-53]
MKMGTGIIAATLIMQTVGRRRIGTDTLDDDTGRMMLMAVSIDGSMRTGVVTMTVPMKDNRRTRAVTANGQDGKQHDHDPRKAPHARNASTCFSAFIPTSRAQPADLILESGSFLAEGVSLGG